jgi:rare lipoprotein A
LPFGTKLKVTNLANNESVVVEVNDRGPQKTSRELDLSKRAFMEITDNKNHGLLKVKIEIIK